MIKQIFEDDADPAATTSVSSPSAAANNSNSLPAPLKLEVKSPLAADDVTGDDGDVVSFKGILFCTSCSQIIILLLQLLFTFEYYLILYLLHF